MKRPQRSIRAVLAVVHRAAILAVAAACAMTPFLAVPVARAQGPDLNGIALAWTRGRFFSPVVCEVAGQAGHALRRLVIRPGPEHVHPPVNRVTFFPIEVEGASHCKDPLGGAQPDLRGALQIHLPGHSRPDLAQSEFKRAMRSTGGFDFEILEGRLQVTGWGEEDEPRVEDFAGGQLRLRTVRPRTDAARVLSGFPGDRKLRMELQARDGEVLTFHLVQYGAR